MDFKELKKLVLLEYKKNGYFDEWEKARKILKKHGIVGIVELAEVGLFVTEVAEGMEEIRNNNKEKLATELADTIIRIMNFASRRGINLEDAILRKHKKNLKREKLHGRPVM